MTGRNKTPLLGWHPPAELSAWVRAEAERRDVKLSAVLNEAIEAYRKLCEARLAAEPLRGGRP
jgi:hypothetical protein